MAMLLPDPALCGGQRAHIQAHMSTNAILQTQSSGKVYTPTFAVVLVHACAGNASSVIRCWAAEDSG